MIASISGIRRSGNHAIAMWLLSHLDCCEYYNNHILNGKRTPSIYYKINGLLLNLTNPSDHSDNDKVVPTSAIYGLENFEIDKIKNFDTECKILIVRDPVNNLASILKHKGKLVNLDEFRKLWRSYAAAGDEFVKVIYDKWFCNHQYRRSIEKKLGLEEDDSKLNKVHSMGGGSSFDKVEFQNNAQQMDVLKRWWHFRKDDKFLDIINDKELLRLREQIFGKLPANLRHRLRNRKPLTDEELTEKYDLK